MSSSTLISLFNSIIEKYKGQLLKPVSVAPLVTFRIAFGLMMFFSILRFWLNGWITSLYVMPKFYFPLMGIDWVRPLGYTGMHLLFLAMGISALLIAIGLFYRLAIVVFFLCFTYVEFIDITNYLNHYYFINIAAFLMIWLPANRRYSLDAFIWPEKRREKVPAFTLGTIRLQLALVYFFAGVAKLNSDWLLHALPMRIWLPAKSHLPVVGTWMYEEWVAYLFSWFGACYDLFIVFFLLNKKTRPVAYLFVLVFHTATAIFFPGIGMFPYVMMTSSLIFFSGNFHEKLLGFFSKSIGKKQMTNLVNENNIYQYKPSAKRILLGGLSVYFVLQLLLPIRNLFYPGLLFWTEEGYRFSWRVMLLEKSGNSFFYVKEPATGRTFEVDNAKFLTPLQEKMMSTQPDMMVQYAHHLRDIYAHQGIKDPAVYAETYVALNGRHSILFTDTTVDLAAQPLGWKHYTWILPFKSHDKQ